MVDQKKRQYSTAKVIFLTNGAIINGHPYTHTHTQGKTLYTDLKPYMKINS